MIEIIFICPVDGNLEMFSHKMKVISYNSFVFICSDLFYGDKWT